MATIPSPRGVAVWASVNDPDTKFNAAGVYSVKLAFDPNEPAVQAFLAKAEAARDAEFAKQAKELEDAGKKGLVKNLKVAPLFTAEVDNETGDETGRILINFKMTASGVSKKTGKPWSRKPTIVNGAGVVLKNPPKVGSGSVLKVSCELRGYYVAKDKEVGVSYKLEGVQIIKLVTFGTRDAASMGFGAEEDADDVEDAAPAPAAAGGAADDDGDDGL